MNEALRSGGVDDVVQMLNPDDSLFQLVLRRLMARGITEAALKEITRGLTQDSELAWDSDSSVLKALRDYGVIQVENREGREYVRWTHESFREFLQKQVR